MLFEAFMFGLIIGTVFTAAIGYFASNAVEVVAEEEAEYTEMPPLVIVRSNAGEIITNKPIKVDYYSVENGG